MKKAIFIQFLGYYFPMDNLPNFLRAAREAQEIRQAELAKLIGIRQPSIARFEKMKASLSIETLLKMTPLLNINPSYIQSRQGNPFKQANPEKIIKLLILDDVRGNPDFSLVKLIADTNNTASFFFLRPDFIEFETFLHPPEIHNIDREYPKWRKQIRRGLTIYALFVQDESNNSYIFKKKDDSLFGEQELTHEFQETEAKSKKHFDIRTISIRSSTWKKIKAWSALSNQELSDVLNKGRFFPNHAFLLRLCHEVWGRKEFNPDPDKYEKIKAEITGMNESQLNSQVRLMIPDLEDVITKHFLK